VDFHAEATSEKLAMGWLLRDKVSAVIGTHTHVQTADERIYPEKAAYISDAGMVGPYNSVLGLDPDKALRKLIYGLPSNLDLAPGKVIFNGVLLELDPDSGKALKINRVSHIY
jgi:calcineurin-like phosphoesterase